MTHEAPEPAQWVEAPSAGPITMMNHNISTGGGPPTRQDHDTTSFSTAATSELEPDPSSSLHRGPMHRHADPDSRPQSHRLPSPSPARSHAPSDLRRMTHPRRWPSSSRSSVVIPAPAGADAEHHEHPQQRERHAALQRVASGIRRLTRPTTAETAALERDWSVFEEVMVHDGIQPAASSSSHSRAHAQRPDDDDDDGDGPDVLAPAVHVTVPTPAASSEAGYATFSRLTQSPVSVAHTDDYFVHMEAEEEQGEGEGWRYRYRDRESSLDTGRQRASRSRGRESVDTDPLSSLASANGADQENHKTSGGKERRWWPLLRPPTLPTLYRNILKCSLAYFLGSLFTYYPPLSRFISELTQDGPGEKYPSAMGHMVETV